MILNKRKVNHYQWVDFACQSKLICQRKEQCVNIACRHTRAQDTQRILEAMMLKSLAIRILKLKKWSHLSITSFIEHSDLKVATKITFLNVKNHKRVKKNHALREKAQAKAKRVCSHLEKWVKNRMEISTLGLNLDRLTAMAKNFRLLMRKAHNHQRRTMSKKILTKKLQMTHLKFRIG